MKDMFDTILTFVEAHWELILHIVLLLVSSVLFIIRKKPIKMIDGVLTNIYKWALELIPLCEEKSKVESMSSEQKFFYVYEEIQRRLCALYFPDENWKECPLKDVYSFIIEEIIESILDTPHKKG